MSATLRASRPAFWAVAFFSMCINLLMLTSPIYMLQIYDRVLISRSFDTLLLLSVVAIAALVIYGVLEAVRSRVLVRIGNSLGNALAEKIFQSVLQTGKDAQAFRYLESIRSFITGRSLTALFDAPWTPIFIALVYFLHPWLGHVALVGTIMLVTIAVANEAFTRKHLNESSRDLQFANQFVEAGGRNKDTLRAMGMLPGLGKVWHNWHDSGLVLQSIANDRMGVFTGAAKFLRVTIQVAILGVGAYLAINEVTSAGVMIAASIITGRALAPVEAAISGWRSFVQARDSHARLKLLLDEFTDSGEVVSLPVPEGEVVFENVFGAPPGHTKPTLSAISFRLQSGTSVGLTGPSAAGKSTLAKLLVGAWNPIAGEIRLDGAEFNQWHPAQLGQHIGYLSQDVELFPGTVAENIARFSTIDSSAVVKAAKLAGAHEAIVNLDNGYEARVGVGGLNLSGGQRQRIGLARAFYKNPPLIVLDEPTSNLDALGEGAVRAAVEELKQAGSTVIVIAHKPSLVCGVDLVMVIQSGRLTHFGPAAKIMPQITRVPNDSASAEDAVAT